MDNDFSQGKPAPISKISWNYHVTSIYADRVLAWLLSLVQNQTRKIDGKFFQHFHLISVADSKLHRAGADTVTENLFIRDLVPHLP